MEDPHRQNQIARPRWPAGMAISLSMGIVTLGVVLAIFVHPLAPVGLPILLRTTQVFVLSILSGDNLDHLPLPSPRER